MKKSYTFLVGALFVFSGVTSLVYESLWIRVLSLGVGSTSDSISMVLSIFFFGLSVGSYLAGHYSQKIKNPLLTYGALEGFIGVYSFVIIFILINFHHILSVLPLTGSFSWLGTFLKFFLVFLFLILPSMAMGATLPLLVQYFIRTDENRSRYISILYAVNTLGAVIGAFAAGFIVIPKFGVLWGNNIMVVLNLGIFASTYWLSKKYKLGMNAGIDLKTPTAKLKLSKAEKAILLACGLCGFSSIAAEVVWNKYLGIFMGTNIFGLGLVLSLFLFGIALGSYVLSIFIERVKNPRRLFMILLVLAGCLILLASQLLNVAPAVANVVAYYLAGKVPLIVIKCVVSGFVLFLPTVVFGALLPLGITLLSKSKDSVARLTGVAYAINTIGSIIGSCLAGLVLIPNLGSGTTIEITIFALFVGALCCLYAFENRQLNRVAGTMVLIVLGIFAVLQGSIEYRNIIKSAYYQTASADMSLADAMKYFSRDYEEFQQIHEGKTAIISLSHDPQDGANYRDYMRLKTNGLNESVYNLKNLTELPKYEALLGYLPYAVSRSPQSAFIVGYGGGFTVDYLTSMDIKDVYVVELEKGILKAADTVYKGENPITKRPNLRLSIEDARFVLAAKLYGPYDIIVSQPSHSWLSGVANLFTKEFFTIVKSNLTENGVFSQWLNLYNMDEVVIKSILKTFYEVFPHGAVFTNYDDDELIMLGSSSPISFDYEKLQRMTKDPALQKRLSQVPFKSVGDVLSNFLVTREKALEWSKDGVINTDINAYAEVKQSTIFYSKGDHSGPQSFLSQMFDSDFGTLLPAEALTTEFQSQLLDSQQKLGKFDKFFVGLKKFEETAPPSDEKTWKLGQLCLQAQRYDCARVNLETAFETKRTTERLNALIGVYMQLGNIERMEKLLVSNRALWSKQTECYALEAGVKSGHQQLWSIGDRMSRDVGGYTQACGNYFNKALGLYYAWKNELTVAIPFLEAYHNGYSYDTEAYSALLASYLKTKDYANATPFAEALRGIVNRESKRLKELADFYSSKGNKADADVLNGLVERLKL